MRSPSLTTASPGIRSQVWAAAARRTRWERRKPCIAGSCAMWCAAWHWKTSSLRCSGSTLNNCTSLAFGGGRRNRRGIGRRRWRRRRKERRRIGRWKKKRRWRWRDYEGWRCWRRSQEVKEYGWRYWRCWRIRSLKEKNEKMIKRWSKKSWFTRLRTE